MNLGVRWAIGVGVAIAGAAAIGGGYLLAVGDFKEYASAGLLEIGVAFLLLIPLLLFERLFERRVQEVRMETEGEIQRIDEDVGRLRDETTAQIGTLQQAVETRLEANSEEDRRAVESAETEVSFENIYALFERAEQLNGLSRRGLRVQLPSQWQRVRFRLVTLTPEDGAEESTIRLDLEDPRGNEEGPSAIWRSGEHVVDVLARFAESWQQAGSFPGQKALDADAILTRLIRGLDLAIRSRTGDDWGNEPLRPLIELPNDAWAMTDFGLEHTAQPSYPIKVADIVDDPHIRRHMLGKNWVVENESQFEDAFTAAQMYFEKPKRRQRPVS